MKNQKVILPILGIGLIALFGGGYITLSSKKEPTKDKKKKIVKRGFACSLCKKEFETPRSLEIHMARHNTL